MNSLSLLVAVEKQYRADNLAQRRQVGSTNPRRSALKFGQLAQESWLERRLNLGRAVYHLWRQCTQQILVCQFETCLETG